MILKNCYNYGSVSNAGDTTHCGAIIGWERNYGSGTIVNNYYLDSASALAYGSGSKSGVEAVSKTAEQFASGEVTYLLNGGVTDGTQVWYQNIDNDKSHNEYPVFNGGIAYAVNEKNGEYSNYEPASDTDTETDSDTVLRLNKAASELSYCTAFFANSQI